MDNKHLCFISRPFNQLLSRICLSKSKKVFLLLLLLISIGRFSYAQTQAPSISYTSSSNTYTVGTTITSITPTNAFPVTGLVPADNYGNVTNFAGTNLTSGHVDATSGAAKFSSANTVAVDQSTGNLYLAEFGYNCIRKITPAGVVTTFAGNPTTTTPNTPNDGTGTAANFNGPNGIIIDATNSNLYVSDNFAIRKIVIATAAVTTIAGNGTSNGSTDATGTAASFNVPVGMALNTLGTILYVSDWKNNEIRQINLLTTAVTTFAGSTTAGYVNGTTGLNSQYNSPYWLGYDGSGNFLLVDKLNNAIRSVNITTGATTNFVGSSSGSSGFNDATGTAALFNTPKCIVKDGAGNYYVSDNQNNRVRRITPAGVVTTLAGSATAGNTAGIGTAATLNNPFGLAMEASTVEKGYIYCADQGSSTVRKISINGYTIFPALPAGLSFNGTTGTISGTPTTPSALTTYTVTAYNYYGSSACSLTILVNPTSPVIASLTQCGNAGTLTASGGTPAAGTYNWYSAATGGTLLQSSTSTTYGVVATGTYYVSYTSGGITSPRTAVTATINPVVASPISGSEFMYPFSGNVASANALNDVSGNNDPLIPYPTTATGPTLSADRYNAANCAYTFNGTNQYLATTKSFINPTVFSLSLWFNTTTASGGKLIGFDQYQASSGQFDRHIYMTNSGQLIFGIYNSGYLTITSPLSYNDGYWHHVVVTLSPTAGSVLYVDGIAVASSSTMTVPEPHNGYWRIGYDNISGWPSAPSSNYFAGQIDDVSIYDRALSAAEVTTSHNLNLMGNVISCPGNPATFTAQPINGASYSWTDGTNTVTGNPATFSSSIAGNYTLTVTGGPGGCASTATVTCNSGDVYTWTGATSTDPSVATNWNYTTQNINNQVPAFDGTMSLIIPAGLTNYPVLTANESVYSVTLGNGATLTLGGYTLSVACHIYNNATGSKVLYGGNTSSGITFNGAISTQYFYGSATAGSGQTGNLTVNNSASGTVTLSGGVLDLYNTLTLTNGNLAVAASPAILTLKSSASLSASVAAIPSGSSITGTVNVERFITGGAGYRGYRLMSSPVFAGTANSNNVYSLNYLSNSVVLTGSTGTAGGFDKTGNPTIYLYREDLTPANTTFTNGNFWGISTLNNSPAYNYYLNGGSTVYNLPVGCGYMFFFRGNRASATVAQETVSSYVPVTVTLTASGTLNQGQIIAKDWYTPTSAYLGYTGTGLGTNHNVRGFNLVGNPYASTIDWEQYNTTTSTAGIYANNVANTVYELNPLTNNYDTYQKGGVKTNNGSRYIASGQAFYVQASSSANPQLIFNESAKTLSENTGLTLFMAVRNKAVNFNAVTPTEQHLRLQLAKDSINTDDIYIGFSAAASAGYAVNEDAAYKPGNGKVSLASVSADHIALAINKMPFPGLNTTIPLVINATADGVYKLNRTEFDALPPIYEIWLKDAYKKDSLDIRNNTTYAFDLSKADTNSFGANRFSIVVRQNPALMVHLLSFSAIKSPGVVQVGWRTENEQNYTTFEVEKSIGNGQAFESLGTITSNNSSAYGITDKAPANGSNQYRLKLTDLNGTITYSNIINVMYGNGSNSLTNSSISVYPNPTRGLVNLSITTPFNSQSPVGTASNSASKTIATNQVYTVKIISNTGQLVKTATINGTAWQNDISNFTPGAYVIQVLNSNNSVVGKETFIKL